LKISYFRALKEKNVGGLVHLIRGVGGKKLSTLEWESSLRGDGFYKEGRQANKPRPSLNTVSF
jgi:hypothetical protein